MPLNTTLPSVSQAQSLLTPAQSDQSVGVLNHLFGIPNGNWHSLYYQTIGGSGQGSLFFNLLQDFDLVVLAFVTIMVFITMAIGATSTAHEGKAFGNRYHALWTPLRSAFAMVLLAPIPGVGLSLIQGALLLMVWFSIGGANYLATQATSYMVKHGGELSSITPGGGRQIAKEILQSELTSQYLVNYETTTPAKLPAYNAPTWTPPTPELGGDLGHWTITFNAPPGLGLSGQIGTIVIPCFSQSGPMCTARKGAIITMIGSEYKYAASLVNSSQAAHGSVSTATSVKPATSAPSVTDPAVIQAGQTYDTAVAGAIPQEVALAKPALQGELVALNQNVSHLGWFSLGSFYWEIAHANQSVQVRVDQYPKWTGYDQKAIGKKIGKTDARRLGQIIDGASHDLQKTEAADGIKNYQSELYKVFSAQGPWYAKGPVGLLLKGDPVANLQETGDWIVNGEIPSAIGTYMLIRSIASGANAESKGAGWFGEGTNWLTGAANAATKAAGPIVMGILVGLFIVGVTWAYYLPSVPFILWMMGIIGWLIFVIEALVGSVVWAAGIALPEGEGIFGPRGDQGVMLFINVMFRPALMVVGFFASFLLLDTVGSWVGANVGIFMGSAFGTGVQWNPITWIAAAVIISILAVLLVHKIFGIILWIPDNVMRWVGGQGPQLGEGQSEQQARGAFVGAGAVVQRAAPDGKGKGDARGGVGGRKSVGAGDAAGGEGEEVGGKRGGADVAGGGDVIEQAPPTKPE